jgi:hypothetical protein
MAKMVPVECDLSRRPQSEIQVFNAINQQFNDEWTVYHAFDYISRDMHKFRWDGEIDFLLYHPSHGILVLEVKGGQISHRDGQWYQNDRKIACPFEQAKRNKYAVLQLLGQSLGLKNKIVPVKLAHAVCFPTCGNCYIWPPEASGLVATGNELPYLKDFIISVLAETRPIKAKIENDISNTVRQILMPYFDYGYRLFERAGIDEHILMTCTESQCAILSALDNFKTLLVRGCAGSGKTIMAIKRAIQLASKNKNVLLICYNQLLAEHIKKTVSAYPQITVSAFYDYCFEKLQLLPEELSTKQQDNNFYQEELPERLCQYFINNSFRFDAVIVDEGQDFSYSCWKTMQNMVITDGHFYIFYDPDQNLFQPELTLPALPYPPIILNRNCRNTRKIFDAIKSYSSDMNIAPMDAAPEGTPVKHYYVKDAAVRRELLTNILHSLVKDEMVNLSDIVIIGGHALDNTCIGDSPMLGNIHVITGHCPSGENQIAYHSYMKFKGCESPVVILLDVCDDDPRWQKKSAKYTAMSRARHLLIIIHAQVNNNLEE